MKPRFELLGRDRPYDRRQEIYDHVSKTRIALVCDTSGEYGPCDELVDLANAMTNWKQIAMEETEAVEALLAFVASKGLTDEWHDYDWEE